MPKSPNQKLKILYLMKIFLSETDETHKLSMGEIISRLADYGVFAERKTVYDDIEALRHFGVDIVMEKSKSYGYYVASREFELPELKLLVDAVQSSKFITVKKSNELIKKIEGLASRHEAGRLQRQVFVGNRIKTMNESIYYNVDAIHEAIVCNKKISFKYFEYNLNKEKVFRRDGEKYIASPIALSWDDENYYLIARSASHDGLTHYRVDKMSSISVLDELREVDIEFDSALYAKKVFGMFGGEEQTVKLRFDNRLVGVVIDRFGKDIPIMKDGDEYFIITVKVAVSPVFIGWIFQFGDMVTVIEPENLINEMKRQSKNLLDKYE